MTLQKLKEESIQLVKQYPFLEDQIRDLFFLAQDEIEEGDSESHACELAWNSMLDLVENGEV